MDYHTPRSKAKGKIAEGLEELREAKANHANANQDAASTHTPVRAEDLYHGLTPLLDGTHAEPNTPTAANTTLKQALVPDNDDPSLGAFKEFVQFPDPERLATLFMTFPEAKDIKYDQMAKTKQAGTGDGGGQWFFFDPKMRLWDSQGIMPLKTIWQKNMEKIGEMIGKGDEDAGNMINTENMIAMFENLRTSAV